MARPIRLELSSEMIRLDDHLNVHKTLLCNVSERLRKLVESEEKCQKKASLPESNGKRKRDSSPLRLNVLEDGNRGSCRRALELWSSFLYGQSMAVPASEWPRNHYCREEYYALLHVHQFGLEYNHLDAVDASIDGIRDLLYHENDLCWFGVVTPSGEDTHNSIPMQVLKDFLVYGEHGDRYTELVDTNLKYFESCTDPVELAFKEKQAIRRRNLLRFSNDLLKMMMQKGKDERAGLPMPDLMARRRYHTHAEKGQPCYLDN